MEWTREERYRRIEDEDPAVIEELKKKVSNCPWRQAYHIQPVVGLLNDPNGFAFYQGEYHLFYQWFPLGPVHGLKHWYHTKSTDLVHWENVGVGIVPGDAQDSHGAYSGSAIEHQGQLYLLYTGNTRDADWVRHPKQNVAVMDQQGQVTKWDDPVIAGVPAGYTDHFRDPKVWKVNDRFYAILGAQRVNETGCVVLYSSPDFRTWSWEGEVITSLPAFGYMWECPDYFELDGQGVLLFSPQGLVPEGDRYQNIYQSGYLLGEKLDLENRVFRHEDFIELDRGFDFYAQQTTEAPDGRRILVGWMGLPEIAYPTDSHGWAHCLTLARELTIENGRLKQRPVRELTSLRGQSVQVAGQLRDEVSEYAGFVGTSYELSCTYTNENAQEFGIEFRAGEEERTVISYDVHLQKVVLDRTHAGEPVGEAYGTVRHCSVPEPTDKRISFHLFVDTSSVEIFINDGDEVFTSRIFPRQDSQAIRFFAKGGSASFTAEKWELPQRGLGEKG